MNCVRKLLLARELSARPGVLRQLAPGLDLLRLQGSSCAQRFWPVPVRSHSKFTPAVKGDQEKDGESRDGSLVPLEELFERACKGERNKAAFTRAVELFCQRDVRRRGHIEFIYAALQKMPQFGVERELDVYNKILDVFPKEVFVPRNFIQRMFNHYPRQQECGIHVLEQMENYGIMPDNQTKFLLLQIFGAKSHPVRKYQRLMYWFPKFKHVNPYPVPVPLPQEPIDLARISLQRIAADLSAKVTVYQMPLTDILDSGKEITQPHIVGIQSPDQQELLAHHNPDRPVFVEGPFPLWLKKTCVYYYVLRGELLPPGEKGEMLDSERNFYYPMHLDLDLDRGPWDDEEFDVDEDRCCSCGVLPQRWLHFPHWVKNSSRVHGLRTRYLQSLIDRPLPLEGRGLWYGGLTPFSCGGRGRSESRTWSPDFQSPCSDSWTLLRCTVGFVPIDTASVLCPVPCSGGRPHLCHVHGWGRRSGHFGQVDFGPAAEQSYSEPDARCVPPRAGAPGAAGGL